MELIPAPWHVSIWPILASMFMFRIALYLHALQHEKRRPTLAQTLAYFFMLPNVCFPLYPVVDFVTFNRTYYDRAEGKIHRVGVKWIARGLLHLILYRFVYMNMAGDPSRLATLGEVVGFMLATFLLYLRVSGQFHLIVGVLHLFGFRLPETHHLYYLASSFTDVWRRINIYWKDFMMKLVYYPSYFRFRRRGDRFALIVSTVIVFLITWILHSYQWFWLRGDFPIELQDALFWTVLGAFVVTGSLSELKHPQQRRLGPAPRWSGSLALRRLFTFSVICVLWSLWSADSVLGWLLMWTAAGNIASGDLWILGGLLLGGLIVAGREWSVREPADPATLPFYRQPVLYSTALLAGLLIAGSPELYARYSPRLADTVATLQRSTLNAHEALLQHKGYYEKLDNVSRMSTQLWSVQTQRPVHWVSLGSTPAYRLREDFLRGELQPDAHIIFEDQPLTTNRWGMRDRDYTMEKPEGVYRIALLGPSHVMGSGVADGETFADFLEERLNHRTGSAPNKPRYEVLNFGVAGYSLTQQLGMLEMKALAFQPDAVFITDGAGLKDPIIEHLTAVLYRQFDIPFPGLYETIDRAGVRALAKPGLPVPFDNFRALLGALGIETRMPGREATMRLRPLVDEIIRWTFLRIASLSREHGAVPVFLALENVKDPPIGEMNFLQEAEVARLLVFNLFGLWQGYDKAAFQIAEWDEHPNAAGNRVIADRLFEMIQQHRSELRLPEYD
jgi:hypothetical protein